MARTHHKAVKCYTPGCNATFSTTRGLNNHQRQCGQDLAEKLVIRIKKRRIHDIKRRQKEQAGRSDSAEGTLAPMDSGGDMILGPQVEVDIAHLELQSETVLRHSRRQRRLPARYLDILPPSPPDPEQAQADPASQLDQAEEERCQTESDSNSPTQSTTVSRPIIIFKTKPNRFNVFRYYLHGRPSIYPAAPTTGEVANCPNFEQVQNSEKRPWWSLFGSSVKSIQKKVTGPFEDISTMLLMNWAHSGTNTKSNPEIDRLVHDVLQAPGFSVNDLTNFNATRESERLDKYSDSGINPNDYMFKAKDGWIEGSVEIPLPCEGKKQKSEAQAPKFEVSGVLYRRPLEIIKAALNDPVIETYHWIPYREYWKPSESSPPERIYSELYNSDAFLEEYARLQNFSHSPDGSAPQSERVIIAIMLWSDSTHLASFGSASLWPIYMYFGNQSKYVRSKVTAYAANHLAYIPKLSSTFQDFYRAIFGVPASSDTITHCKRELIHLVWLLILDQDFMHAYVHGIEHVFLDGIQRLVFPRLFTYAADYPEKVLLACIKYLGNCPCPRCYVLKKRIEDVGKKPDIRNRAKNARIDSLEIQASIALVRKWMFELGLPIRNAFVVNQLGPQSLTPVQSAFSKRLFAHGINHYDIFVPDLLHEFELGVWKATFTHLIRILFANGGQGIQMLNERYRDVPTFGRGTIRRFGENASSMKKLAARDYEDLLQCALPVFEALLPHEFDMIVQDLIFELCTWHALAKLRLHTESTLHALEHSTRRLGFALREFKKKVCSHYVTKELPSEEAARGRRNAVLAKKATKDRNAHVEQIAPAKAGKNERVFNLSTYKLHALGDYPSAIRKYGTTDGFTSQVGEAQHKFAKRFYSRASKAEHTRSIAKQQHRQKVLRKLHERYIAVQRNQQGNEEAESGSARRKRANYKLDAEMEKLATTDATSHYHMASDTKNSLNIRAWPGDELEDDPACKDFLPQLLDHLLSRLLGNVYDGDEATFSSAERSTVRICNNTIYSHQAMRVNYTTYDLRREQDTINVRTKPDIMLLSREDSPDEDGLQPHPYWYARVIGIFHTYVVHTGPQSKSTLPQRMDFILVRWFGRNRGRSGWKSRRLLKIGFVDSDVPGAFGFLDPALIIRGAHLEPAFAYGRTDKLLPPSIARQPHEGDDDWQFFYVNIFVDRDMVMRYFGGGVGHASIREATNTFLSDRCREELEDAEGTDDEEEPCPLPTSNKEPDIEEDYGYESNPTSENENENDEVEGNETDEEECRAESEADDEEHAEL